MSSLICYDNPGIKVRRLRRVNVNIRIVNLRNYIPVPGEVLIKVDRSSVLGNPFIMYCEVHRDDVCDWYKYYFNKKINTTFNSANDTAFDRALTRICDTLLVSDVALGCWCAPKRCHAETIVDYVCGQILSATYVGGTK